ncbi:protein of unknown function [Magnetospira sp. QH-2]|nr:protein of unknown function [Magnetospira sp. QH-2]
MGLGGMVNRVGAAREEELLVDSLGSWEGHSQLAGRQEGTPPGGIFQREYSVYPLRNLARKKLGNYHTLTLEIGVYT